MFKPHSAISSFGNLNPIAQLEHIGEICKDESPMVHTIADNSKLRNDARGQLRSWNRVSSGRRRSIAKARRIRWGRRVRHQDRQLGITYKIFSTHLHPHIYRQSRRCIDNRQPETQPWILMYISHRRDSRGSHLVFTCGSHLVFIEYLIEGKKSEEIREWHLSLGTGIYKVVLVLATDSRYHLATAINAIRLHHHHHIAHHMNNGRNRIRCTPLGNNAHPWMETLIIINACGHWLSLLLISWRKSSDNVNNPCVGRTNASGKGDKKLLRGIK